MNKMVAGVNNFSRQIVLATAEVLPDDGGMNTIYDVASLWPSIADFAADAGVSSNAARRWIERNRVPAPYFSAIIRGAKARLLPLTLDDLARIAEKKGNT